VTDYYSLSEYGCNTNTRKFEEVASLYSTNMTSVYSGGLVYEYSNEASNYGLVTIDGSNVTELPDFAALQTAYSGTPNPSGDGGYSSSGTASQCPPAQAPEWVVGTTLIPSMPAGAQKYLTSGAGTGPGLNGPGSQNSGSTFQFSAANGGSAGTVDGGSNGTSSGSGGGKKGAASGLHVPVGSIAGLIGASLVAILFL
jgi:hypothetical protein